MEIREHYPAEIGRGREAEPKLITSFSITHTPHSGRREQVRRNADQSKFREIFKSHELMPLLQFINLVAGHFSTDLGYSQPACHTFCSLANLFRTAFKPVHSSEPDSPPAQAVGTRVPESALRALGGRSQFSLAVAKHESLPVIRKEPRQPAASPKAYPSPPHI